MSRMADASYETAKRNTSVRDHEQQKAGELAAMKDKHSSMLTPVSPSSRDRRRRSQISDPFPYVQTTETPTITIDDVLHDESRSPAQPRVFSSLEECRSSIPKSKHPLRPAQDVLNRLVWDTSLQRQNQGGAKVTVAGAQELSDAIGSPEDLFTTTREKWTYTIGYQDRFVGIKETSLDQWLEIRKDSDGEDWMPMHRVMWIKRRLNNRSEESEDATNDDDGKTTVAADAGEVIWDRLERIDKVFRSGNSTLEESCT